MYEAKRRKLHREPADDSPTRSPVELDREDLNQPETSPSRNFPRDLEEQGNPLTYGPKDRAQFEASRGAEESMETVSEFNPSSPENATNVEDTGATSQKVEELAIAEVGDNTDSLSVRPPTTVATAPQAGHTGTAAKIRVEHGLVKRLTQGINEKDARSV
ncbi:hypothetical protein LTR66_011072 [Elasticomyces elasticus]|nr:hypothetical protein LTR66_011072 [Elasticomyces elasticus]